MLIFISKTCLNIGYVQTASYSFFQVSSKLEDSTTKRHLMCSKKWKQDLWERDPQPSIVNKQMKDPVPFISRISQILNACFFPPLNSQFLESNRGREFIEQNDAVRKGNMKLKRHGLYLFIWVDFKLGCISFLPL